MKKIAYMLTAALAMIVAACTGTDTGMDYLVSPDYIEIDSVYRVDNSGMVTIPIRANCSWTITGFPDNGSLSLPEGAKLSDTGNYDLTIICNPHDDTKNQKETYMQLHSVHGVVTQFKIVQAPAAPRVSFRDKDADGNTMYEVSYNAGAELTVYIDSNTAWECFTNEDWCTFKKDTNNKDLNYGEGNGSVTLVFSENTSIEKRNVTLTVRATTDNAKSAQCTITQSGGECTQISDFRLSKVDGDEFAFIATATLTSTNPITDCGICYTFDEDEEPTIENSEFVKNKEVGANRISMSITLPDLKGARKYYVRAYAVNSAGISYSQKEEFETPGKTPQSSDNPDLNP